MSDFLDPRIAREVLRRRLSGTEPITDEDVRQARHLASGNPAPENISLYSRIKGEFEHSTERTAPLEPVKPTAEDVEAARLAAKTNPSIQNMASFASTKRQFEEEQ